RRVAPAAGRNSEEPVAAPPVWSQERCPSLPCNDCLRCVHAGLEAAGPPCSQERAVFVSRVLPDKMAGVDQVKLAVWQPLVEKLSIDGRDDHVSAAGNDLHGRLNLRQGVAQHLEL